LAIATSLVLWALPASANILSAEPEMGDLLRWGAFSLGGGVTDTTTADNFSGTTDIFGDVGVAGSGNITMSGSATIHGNLYYRSNGTLKKSGNAKITGATFHNSDGILDNDVINANNTDTTAFSHSDSGNYTVNGNPGPLTNVNGSQNITLAATAPGTNVYLKLSNFVRTGGTFTLSGTASNNFIINVSNQFSLSGGAKIVLSGGVTWDNVLFNVHGTGSDVTLSGQSSMAGILMATKRTVSITGQSSVGQKGGPFGEVIANKITMTNSQIVHVSE
jgi:fibronectin-binding autotransporter adhesin